MKQALETTHEAETIIGAEFPKKTIPLIEAAQHSIDIIVYDWRWYANSPGSPAQLFSQAIVRAGQRGVKVRVIANEEGIVQILRKLGIEAKKLTTPKRVHVKMIIIDQKIAILGSHNYTESAFLWNYELSVILKDLSPKNRFMEFFNNLYRHNY